MPPSIAPVRAPPTVVLRGPDHIDLDAVAVRELEASTAVALTRGRFAKRYHSVAPNEDVVAAVIGPRATLLVVADGHGGDVASVVAVDVVLGALGGDPPPADLQDRAVVALYDRANRAVLDAARQHRPPQDSSTTLALALVARSDGGGMRVQWASFGDSAVFLAREVDVVDVARPRMLFVGHPMSTYEVAGRLQRGVEDLPAPDPWVVLASDGFTNFVRDPAGVVATGIERAASAKAVAAALVAAACEGGAGDNVAIAVVGGGGAA